MSSLGIFALPSPAQTYFYNKADFPTGNYPTGIVLADFNGDGRLDLAITNSSDGTVSILLGKPDGTFGPKTDFPTGNGPGAVVAGDFNDDGNVDLAITNPSSDTVSILLGNGDGTFQEHVDYAVGHLPSSLAVADFDMNGTLDLVVANNNCDSLICGDGTISILLGNGDGSFQAKTDYATPQGPEWVIVGDFNGDSKPDLAVASTSRNFSLNFVSILGGNGDGTFQSHVDYPTDRATTSVAAADFKGDGKLDLVVAVAESWLDFLAGNGDGTFQTPTHIPGTAGFSAYGVLTADLNRDGKMDIVVSNNFANGVSVFLSNGDGTFQPQVDYMAKPSQGALAMGDVNGDGTLDLAITNWYAKTVTVLLGNGDGTFSPRAPVPSVPPFQAAWGSAIEDFNGDGIPDLAVAELNSPAAVAVFPGNGDGTLGTPSISDAGHPRVFRVADFNGDGIPDLAFINEAGAGIVLGRGDGTFGSVEQLLNNPGAGPRDIVVGDFNHDGNADVVVLANGFITSQPIFAFLGNGDGTFQAPKQFWSGPIPMAMAAADFNQDGNLDLAITLNTLETNGLAVMLGNGDGTFKPPMFYPVDTLPGGLTAFDLNGDGIPDLVVTGNKAGVYLGKGDGTFYAPVYYDAGSFPNYVISGDFNGDGKVDLAVVDDLYLSILLGNGDGTFQPPVGFADGGFLVPLAAGDLNVDGITDLMLGGGSGSLFLSKPIVSLFPDHLNFGSQSVGSCSSPISVTLTNVGNSPLFLSDVTTSGDFSAKNTCPNELDLGANCTISVTFMPNVLGIRTGALTLTNNAISSPQAIPLSGIGVAP